MRNKKTHRLMKKFIILLFLILSIPLSAVPLVTYNYLCIPENLQFENKNEWDIIRVKGLLVSEEQGKPILPLDYIYLLIPDGQKAESLHIEINSSYTLPGRYKIKPFLPLKESSPIDSMSYRSCNPYPGVRALIVNTGSFAGSKIVTLLVYPLDYYPKSGKTILFTDLTIELFCSPSNRAPIRQSYTTPYSGRIIQKVLSSIVDNDEDIPFYSHRLCIRNKAPDASYPSYIVITADSLMDAFLPLTHWLTSKGIKADIICLDSILQNYSYDPISLLYDSPGAIRGFLMDAYTNGTQWVLLGGDEEIVPVRYGTSENNDSTVPEQPPSDLYYSDLDGNWNVDEDDLYGEPIDDSVDYYSELFVGRLPCNNNLEIGNWIEKVLSYERNPGNGNYSYLTRVFWTGADELRDEPGYIIENGSYPTYFEHDTTVLEGPYGFHPWGSEVVAWMNNYYGWFNLYGHGAPDQVTVSAPGYNNGSEERDFLVSLDSCEVYHYNLHGGCRVETGNGLDSLNNENYYGIMYLSSCYQGAYDFEHFDLFDIYCGPSIGEAFTMLPKKGGPAFLGYTRYAKETSSMVLHLHFLETLFDDSLSNIGAAEAISRTKVYPHFIHLSHTLFGCPLMPIWTDIPSHLNVAFVDSIPPESTDFEVTITTSTIPVKDAYVCLWKGDEVYTTGYTGLDGKLTLPIIPKTEGIMLLTATKDNFIPSLDTVRVDSSLSSISEIDSNGLPICKIERTPLSRKVTFKFYLPLPGQVKLDIFDLTGRKIVRLIHRKFTRGEHRAIWECSDSKGRNTPTGIYFYQFHYKNQNLRGKFLILK